MEKNMIKLETRSRAVTIKNKGVTNLVRLALIEYLIR